MKNAIMKKKNELVTKGAMLAIALYSSDALSAPTGTDFKTAATAWIAELGPLVTIALCIIALVAGVADFKEITSGDAGAAKKAIGVVALLVLAWQWDEWFIKAVDLVF